MADNNINLIEYFIPTNNFQRAKTKAKKLGKQIHTKYTQYVYHDLYYEYYNTEKLKKIKTYRKQAIHCEKTDTFEKQTFNKHKIPYYQFPSTNKINDIVYVEKLSICVHHNVYINFETRTVQDNNVNMSYDIVVININLENKVDESIINEALNKCLSIFD